MRRICREYCDGVYPYDTRIVAGITLAFMAVSFALLFTYRHAAIRYAIVAAIAVAAVANRRRLIAAAKRIGALRKKKPST